jgi:hypothetical protein
MLKIEEALLKRRGEVYKSGVRTITFIRRRENEHTNAPFQVHKVDKG